VTDEREIQKLMQKGLKELQGMKVRHEARACDGEALHEVARMGSF
jgi:hypothetical protein